MLILETPTKLRIHPKDEQIPKLRQLLTYRDLTLVGEYQRFKKAVWFANKYGRQAFYEELERKKNAINVCLLMEDDKGYWTYSGLSNRLSNEFKLPVDSLVTYPEPKLIPWARVPTIEPRPYQLVSKDNLIEIRHGGVEIGTGLGKSFIILNLIKHYGLPTVVMAPSRSIAWQLYDEFVDKFGKNKVGLFGDGKKQLGKLITVGIAASLARVKPGTAEFAHLASATVFIADESHLCPAETLAQVCFGVCANAPYRFFFSGTQFRNDGADLLLEGITNKIVYHMTVKEGVDQGYLAKPKFKVITVESPSNKTNLEYQEFVDEHFYKNKLINQKAANLANLAVEQLNHQVLILVEHIEQFQYLLPYFKYEVGFAHGGATQSNKQFLPPEYHKSDPNALVERFNKGDLKILVGTSCISTGTDLKPVGTLINLQAGTSEIKIRQAIGRGTRKVADKVYFNYVDFCVTVNGLADSDNILVRHCLSRVRTYRDVYDTVEWIS
jgi:superfamily II DNA or RNA helicase